MGVAVDGLEVGEAPKAQQVRPGQVAVPAPGLVERHAVVDLAAAQQALPGGGAAPPLQLGQQLGLTGRRDPEFPGRDAAAVPARPAVGLALAPEVAVPAEPEDRLAAQAAGAGLGAMGRLAERGRTDPTMPLLTVF